MAEAFDAPLVMRQSWRTMLFIHWEVPLPVLRPLVPQELEIDTYQDSAYISLIPFTISRSRPIFGPPVPTAAGFHEVNARTYVRSRAGIRGIWFFSLDAASSLAVVGARAAYALPYFRATMRMHVQWEPENVTVDYESRRLWPKPLPAYCKVRYRAQGNPAQSAPGSLDEFLVERYVLFTTRSGQLLQARVHHSPYAVSHADLVTLQEDIFASAVIAHPASPALVHYCGGVDVEIERIRSAIPAAAGDGR